MKGLTQHEAIERFKAQVKEAFTPRPTRRTYKVMVSGVKHTSIYTFYTPQCAVSWIESINNKGEGLEARLIKPRK